MYGHILFNVYIDDLLQSLPDGCYLTYADDVTLIATSKLLQEVSLQL